MTTFSPTTMRSIRVATPGGELQLDTTERAEPGAGHVRIAVEACGVCHSDQLFVDGLFPGVEFPVTPGHEIAGRVAAVGDAVPRWQVGDRVVVGWFGGACLHCDACRDGRFMHCANGQVPGLSYPGGFADSVVVPATALARIPDELTAIEAAPLACAGVTTFTALRKSAARAGDVVAVLGLGGLGHLGVQFAAHMGFDTVAIARGAQKAEFAARLGARHYIDSTTQDVAAELLRLGGARVVLATASNSSAMAQTIDGLGANGQLVVVGADTAPLDVNPLQLLPLTRDIHGHPAGTAREIEQTMAFAVQTGIRSITEVRALADADAAYRHVLAGDARFRVVLDATA